MTDKVSIIIGRETSDHLCVTILGPVISMATDYWDGNWINVEIKLQAGSFGGKYKAQIRREEIHYFYKDFIDINRKLKGEIKFKTIEGQLAIIIKADGIGHFVAECSSQDEAGTGNILHFKLYFDQTEIPPILNQLKNVTEIYPIIGNPDA